MIHASSTRSAAVTVVILAQDCRVATHVTVRSTAGLQLSKQFGMFVVSCYVSSVVFPRKSDAKYSPKQRGGEAIDMR
jgi:hypothetical protein